MKHKLDVQASPSCMWIGEPQAKEFYDHMFSWMLQNICGLEDGDEVILENDFCNKGDITDSEFEEKFGSCIVWVVSLKKGVLSVLIMRKAEFDLLVESEFKEFELINEVKFEECDLEMEAEFDLMMKSK